MYPDAIYIGAPRAGSTWIWKNLSQHPDAWTLPYKSAEYLNDKAGHRRKKNFKENKKEILFLESALYFRDNVSANLTERPTLIQIEGQKVISFSLHHSFCDTR